MIVKRSGGMTEFIPSPREKREDLIRDHVLELIALLHERLGAMEEASGNGGMESAQRCGHLLERIRAEERQACELNRRLAGTVVPDAPSANE